MTKRLPLAVTIALVLVFPAVARAGAVLFPSAPGQSASFKPVNPLATGDGSSGYWDNKSYDSVSQGIGSACTAAAIVGGVSCDWKAAPPGTTNLITPRTAASGSLRYYGVDGVMPDTPENFFFSGPFNLDMEVLFQLTAWGDAVEFGWYEAGKPDARTRLLPHAGKAPGPYSDNSGAIDPDGTTSGQIPVDFGFYYRNTRYSTTADDDILFFTESRFNQVGNYFAYFSDPRAGFWPNTALQSGWDDELEFSSRFEDLWKRQQFALFTDGSGRFWLGLEDQIGGTTPAFCYKLGDQPCADYDYNDLLISFVDKPVPEPAMLALMAIGLFGAAQLNRRRR